MKTIKQIQEENRKLILEAIHGCSYEEALTIELESQPSQLPWNWVEKIITLSRVLLALGNKVLFCEGYLCEHLVTNDGLIITTNHIQWDLTKEALEEQTPETQIAINKLLTE